jgi:uncharacterized protein
MSCTYRILISVDGGGVRGVIPLSILDHVYSFLNKEDCDVSRCFDVFAASSTSAIFTGAIMLRDEENKLIYPPQDILNLYKRRGGQLFSKQTSQPIANNKYPLSFLLNRFFDGITMEDLRKHFLFVSYNQSLEEAFIFSDTMTFYRDLSLSKVMQACCAYPGVFPSVKLGNKELIDGVFAAKNPTEIAYHHTRMLYPHDPIIVISLGVGEPPENQSDFFDKESQLIHESMKAKANNDRNLVYFRFQPPIPFVPSRTFTSNEESIDKLIEVTEEYMHNKKEDFTELFDFLTQKSLA